MQMSISLPIVDIQYVCAQRYYITQLTIALIFLSSISCNNLDFIDRSVVVGCPDPGAAKQLQTSMLPPPHGSQFR